GAAPLLAAADAPPAPAAPARGSARPSRPRTCRGVAAPPRRGARAPRPPAAAPLRLALHPAARDRGALPRLADEQRQRLLRGPAARPGLPARLRALALPAQGHRRQLDAARADLDGGVRARARARLRALPAFRAGVRPALTRTLPRGDRRAGARRPDRPRERGDVVGAVVAAAVHEERRRPRDAAQVGAVHVLGDTRRPRVRVEILREAPEVEAELARVPEQVGPVESALVG